MVEEPNKQVSISSDVDIPETDYIKTLIQDRQSSDMPLFILNSY